VQALLATNGNAAAIVSRLGVTWTTILDNPVLLHRLDCVGPEKEDDTNTKNNKLKNDDQSRWMSKKSLDTVDGSANSAKWFSVARIIEMNSSFTCVLKSGK
jgi:hypothetical protein